MDPSRSHRLVHVINNLYVIYFKSDIIYNILYFVIIIYNICYGLLF